MAGGDAESLETLAKYTRSYLAYILVDANLTSVREAKGPIRREDRRPWGQRAGVNITPDEHRSPWEGKRSLRLTIMSRARHEDAITGELAELASLRLIDVDCFETDVEPVGVISIQDGDSHSSKVVTSREPDVSRFLYIDAQSVEAIAADLAEADGVDTVSARQAAIEAEVHELLANDLLVTTSQHLVSRRFATRGWPGAVGVVTPQEALEITYAFLRSRNDFTLQAPPAHVSIGPTLYYSAVARSLMPIATRALRHLLGPAERDRARPAAEHLLGVFARMHDLLVASDHLRVLAQLEGHLGGSNDVVAQQLYHLQNSVVLFTGALDVVAWVIASLDGQSPGRKDVSWRSLGRSGWRAKVTNRDARLLLNAARARDRATKLIDLVTDLRDTYQHRHPIVSGRAEFLNNIGLVEVSIGVVDLGASTGHRLKSRAEVPGLVPIDSLDLAIPQQLQRGLIDVLAHTLERVFGAVEWPEENWWIDQNDGLRWPEIEAGLLRILGPPMWA